MKHHPKNRLDRRRSAEAKSLENPMFRNKKINGKKRKILVDIKEKESTNELHLYDFEDEPRSLPDRELANGSH